MPFIRPWKRLLCPFCFEYFRPGHAPLRVISSDEYENDEVVQKFLDLDQAVMMRPVEPPPTGFLNLIRYFYFPKVRERGRRIVRRICPHCHMDLPSQMTNNGKSTDIIAVTGYRASGKSNFFGVLIDALGNRYSAEVGLNLLSLETFSISTLSTVNSSSLYGYRYGQYLKSARNPIAVPATRSAVQNREIRIPLIYRLNLTKFNWKQRILHPFSHIRPVDLVLFDAAGEDMDSPEAIALYARYLARASGIIALFDPLSYQRIRGKIIQELDESTLVKEGVSDDVVVAQIRRAFERQGALPERKIKTPLAVVISKFDLLRNVEGLEPSVFHDHKHEDGFDAESAQEVSGHLRHFLLENAPRLISDVEANFQNIQFFGMASLGRTPVENQPIESIEPINVADSLFWLLNKLGHLQTKEDMKS
ncbi:MAG: hypothetical protein Q4D38_06250 [Planctomycetia bacterium]|nr:hypothetical protein [Planctomycetia bacterium]